jgi:hypothetical protein
MQAEVLHEVLSGSMDDEAAGGESTRVMRYMSQRLAPVDAQFPNSLFMDDFLMRAEMALGAHNFRADNSLAFVNLCRDEATGILKKRIDDIFGASFNTNGLGACLTCGRLGALLLTLLPGQPHALVRVHTPKLASYIALQERLAIAMHAKVGFLGCAGNHCT